MIRTCMSCMSCICCVVFFLGLIGGCTSEDPLYCDAQKPCEGKGFFCNLKTNTCEVNADTGVPDTGGKDTGTDLPDPDGPTSDLTPDLAGDLPAPDSGPDSGQDAAVPDVLSPDTSAPPKCGDGVVNGSEQCDGTLFNGKTCKTLGYASGTLKCTAKCLFDTTGCVAPAKCGDGLINATNEQCDKTALGGKTCKTQGYTGGSLKCTTSCKLDTTSCYKCGDGKITSPIEVCDGTTMGGKTCKTQGYAGGTLKCESDCKAFDTLACHNCGNNKLDTGEKCDGTALGGKTCKTEGFDGGKLACKTYCSLDTKE